MVSPWTNMAASCEQMVRRSSRSMPLATSPATPSGTSIPVPASQSDKASSSDLSRRARIAAVGIADVVVSGGAGSGCHLQYSEGRGVAPDREKGSFIAQCPDKGGDRSGGS